MVRKVKFIALCAVPEKRDFLNVRVLTKAEHCQVGGSFRGAEEVPGLWSFFPGTNCHSHHFSPGPIGHACSQAALRRRLWE